MELGEAKRILILGCGGAGKSTLARRLGAATGLPVVHLDGLYWQPGWVAMERAAWRRTVENEIAKDAWIIDGNFGLFPGRVPGGRAAARMDNARPRAPGYGRGVPGAVRPELSALGVGLPEAGRHTCEGAAGCAPGGEVRHTEKPAGRASAPAAAGGGG